MIYHLTIIILSLFQKRAKAQSLLDKVFEHLELIEKDYFGLQFVDTGPPTTSTNVDGTVRHILTSESIIFVCILSNYRKINYSCVYLSLVENRSTHIDALVSFRKIIMTAHIYTLSRVENQYTHIYGLFSSSKSKHPHFANISFCLSFI